MASGATPHGRLARLLRGIGALIVLLAVVAGVPILMASVHMLPHGIPSFHQLGQDLKQRDNGQLAAAVIAVGIWICWVLFTLSLLPEVAAAARKRPSHPLPGLAAFQRPAGSLIAAIAIGFTLAPLITGITASRADAAPPLPGSRAVPSISAAAAPQVQSAQPEQQTASSPRSEHNTAKPAARTYEVQPRDTLWKIAEDHLGDPMRYTEIVRLNAHLIGPDNEITTGTVLAMPTDATGLAPTQADTAAETKTTQVRVEQGDTLWSIEERVTGSGSSWQAGWEANKGHAEPGGEQFLDPNLIKPGWSLEIPSSTSSTAAPADTPPRTAPPTSTPHAPQAGGGHDVPGTPSHPNAPSTPVTPSTASTPTQATHTPAQPTAHRAQASSENRYLSLEVGGGLLAATTFAALMIHRRRKFRHRRPGHVVASLPPELVPLEQALEARGRAALAKMTFLDLALRDLAARVSQQPAGVLPDIIGAGINDDYLELYLARDAEQPPKPWVATDALRWTLGRGAELHSGAGRRLAPYPCLVSVGYSPDGTEYLLDLEHAGALQLIGDPARCLDLARYVVAELANNVWSDHLTVTVAGFGQELIAANPSRLAHTEDAHAAATVLSQVAAENRVVAGSAGVDVLEGRLRGTAGDVWMPHVLLAAPGLLEADTDLVRTAAGRGRAAVAVVLSGGLDVGVGSHVEVTGDGTLLTTLLPVADVTAFGLPVADAADVAQAIALDRDGTLDEPTPRSTGDRPWDAFTDAAGALLREYTVPRASSGPAAIDPAAAFSSSVLPGPDEAYVAAAATTEEDLAELAPAVTAETRDAVEKADPELDELVAAWNDPEAKLAKLQVLGPVSVTAHGRPPAKQEDFCAEIVAYLWSKPNGVSTDEFANDLWPRKNYTGTDSYPKDMASRVRHWLGIDPRTGTEYWPRARRGGVQGYSICGLLVDYDLFRRLRVRGEARGADGLPDLVAALDLVSGTPLSHLREFGYEWLPAGDELLYQGAIAEVAHLVATRSLAAGDNAEAIRACEIALQLDAEDDRALLGKIKAYENAGREAEKDATILRLTTLEDPPARTLEVMRRNGWLVRGA
jgi:nucleoid-associated protein YgaU